MNHNTVDADNFNNTLDGYVDYIIDFIVPRLEEQKYNDEQIREIVSLIKNGIRWGKDEKTLEGARKYVRKY
jgi:ribose 5-phosphate isomerase